MRRLFGHIGVSLDGYIDDGAGQPVLPVDMDFQDYIDELLHSIDGMVLGRLAFESLAGYWPSAGDEVTPTQRQLMHELPKYVLSHSLDDADRWNNAHLLSPDPKSAVESLKSREGRPMAVFAGAGAVASVLSMGLLDELRLVVHPSLVGTGTRLFDAGYPSAGLRLRSTRKFPSGAVVLSYDVDASR